MAEQAGGIEQEVARVVGPALDAVAPEAKGGLFLQRRIGRQCRVRLLVAGQHGELDAPLAAGGVELLDAVGPVALATQETRHHQLRGGDHLLDVEVRSEEHTSELQSLMRISYAVFCLKKKKKIDHTTVTINYTKIQKTSIITIHQKLHKRHSQ